MDVRALENCTCLNLRQAARAVTQMYEEALKPSGLRATQFTLLSVISKIGPADMKVLAEALVMDRTTLTRNLRPLIDRNWVEVVEGADGRHRPVALTPSGRDKLAEALPAWRSVQQRLAKGLGRDEWAGLLGGLREAVRLARDP